MKKKIVSQFVKSQKELGKESDKLIGNRDRFENLFEDSQRRWI
jgi:hypothetical protein